MSRQGTIFAVSSGHGKAAIAVIRVSGPGVRFALETMVGRIPPARCAVLSALRDPQDPRRVLDRALVLFFPGPGSATGEDCAEFHCHGGRAVVAAVIGTLAGMPGLRAAEAGEFTRRALLNGRLNLIEVEALADLIDSDTEAQRQLAVEAGAGLGSRCASWRERLLDIGAWVEAEIEFEEEADVAQGLDSQAERAIADLVAEMEAVLSRARFGERLREGVRVALLGRPNAGKSSLLNALAGREVAIVSDTPGTTRDRIEVMLDLDGIAVVLTDTAGLREGGDGVEQEGIRRSLESAASSDLCFWLAPVDEPLGDVPHGLGRDVRVVRTKADLASGVPDGAWCVVSARTGTGLDSFMERLRSTARNLVGSGEPGLIVRERQRRLVESAVAHLRVARAAGAIEVRAEEVRSACRALDRLVGRIDVEDVLGAIFSRFCIGK